MSAVMVDEWTRPRLRLRAVPPMGADAPGERSSVGSAAVGSAAASPATAGRLRLTRRGMGLILGFFVLAMMTSVVLVVTTFLAVSNDPVGVSW